MPAFLDKDMISLTSILSSDDEIIMKYLGELELRFKTKEPKVLSFIPEKERFKRLREEAKVLLELYPNPKKRPSLFGIPIGVKDIFHVNGFDTRAGSQLPKEELKGKEAACVTTLKSAGALIMGKTVTTEFAYLAPGPTRNPHNPSHTPGGSSSGSAAAVASKICPLAFGTQTVGSIIRPASFCGVIGYKPSYDRISKAGVIPLSPSVDHVGFFVYNAEDVSFIASFLCNGWREEESSHKPILGIPEGPYLDKASKEGLASFRNNCKRLMKAGFDVIPIAAMPDFEEISERHYLIVAADAAKVHDKLFNHHSELYRSKTAELIKSGRKISDKSLEDALDGRKKLRDELSQLMDENNIDVWLSPSSTGVAPKSLESTGNPIMNLPWTHSGLPIINLMAGFNDSGLPIGLQLAGRWYKDEALSSWATEIDSALK
ncbi:MAG: amidase [Candidatus Bathyarchaeota archaeon]|nr:amidase [Candidatus Bathyarchaeota archaeon]